MLLTSNIVIGGLLQMNGTNAKSGQVLTATDNSGHAAFAPASGGGAFTNIHPSTISNNVSTVRFCFNTWLDGAGGQSGAAANVTNQILYCNFATPSLETNVFICGPISNNMCISNIVGLLPSTLNHIVLEVWTTNDGSFGIGGQTNCAISFLGNPSCQGFSPGGSIPLGFVADGTAPQVWTITIDCYGQNFQTNTCTIKVSPAGNVGTWTTAGVGTTSITGQGISSTVSAYPSLFNITANTSTASGVFVETGSLNGFYVGYANDSTFWFFTGVNYSQFNDTLQLELEKGDPGTPLLEPYFTFDSAGVPPQAMFGTMNHFDSVGGTSDVLGKSAVFDMWQTNITSSTSVAMILSNSWYPQFTKAASILGLGSNAVLFTHFTVSGLSADGRVNYMTLRNGVGEAMFQVNPGGSGYTATLIQQPTLYLAGNLGGPSSWAVSASTTGGANNTGGYAISCKQPTNGNVNMIIHAFDCEWKIQPN
jgi:hypothetical protein